MLGFLGILWLFCSIAMGESRERTRYHLPNSQVRAVSPDSRYAALVNIRQTEVFVVDLTDGSIPLQMQYSDAATAALAFSPNSRELVLGCATGDIESYDIQRGIRVRAAKVASTAVGAISLSQSPAERFPYLLTTSEKETVLWNFDTLKEVHRFARPSSSSFQPIGGNIAARWHSAIHPNGTLAVESDYESLAVRLFNLQTGKEVQHLGQPYFQISSAPAGSARPLIPVPNPSPVAVAFRPANNSLMVIIWSYQSGSSQIMEIDLAVHAGKTSFLKELSPLRGGVAMSGTGEQLLLATTVPYQLSRPFGAQEHCADYLVDPFLQPESLMAFPKATVGPTSVAISADGKTGVTASQDGFVRVWSL